MRQVIQPTLTDAITTTIATTIVTTIVAAIAAAIAAMQRRPHGGSATVDDVAQGVPGVHSVSVCTHPCTTSWPPFVAGPTRSYAPVQPVMFGAMHRSREKPRSSRRAQH